MKGVADSREVSCKTPRGSCRSLDAQKPRSVLTFEQWRARRLLPADVRFLLFVLVTHVVYGYKTTHRLSFRTSHSPAIAHDRIVRWLHVTKPECSTDVWRSKVAELLLRTPMLRQFLHHFATFIMVLLSSWSPSQALRDSGLLTSFIAIMVWITSLIRPSSLQQYVNHPAGTYRTAVLLLQRYAKLVGTVISFATGCEQQRDPVLLGHWLTLGQYTYIGWQAAVMVVPLRVQLVAGLAEWLIICGVITATKAHYPTAVAAAVTQRTTAALWTYSFVLVYLLPSCVVGIVESRHKRAYVAYLTATGSMATGAAAAVDDGTGNVKAVSKPRSTTPGTAAAAAPNSGSLNINTIDRLRDVLSSLIGPETAKQLTAALSSSSSSSSGSDGGQYVYKQLCTKSAVSVKLSGEHDLKLLGPLMHTSLLDTLNYTTTTSTSSGSSSSGGAAGSRSGLSVVHSVVFRGSVQLFAVVYGIVECWCSTASSRGNDNSSSSGESSAAAVLVQKLRGCLLGASATVQMPNNMLVDVTWDKTYVTFKGSNKQQQQQDAGVAVIQMAKGPQLYFGQACLTAGQSCRLQIIISDATSTDRPGRHVAAAAPPAGSSRCRLLLFQQQTVLLDVETDLHSVLTVEVTPAAAGVVHVAVVPIQQQQQGILAQVLMVLPAAAAAELQQLHKAAAAAETAAGSGKESVLSCEHAWDTMFAGLGADMAFLIGGTTTAAAAGNTSSSNANVLSPEQSVVLKHLLVFLAQHSCWVMARFLVEAVQAAAAVAAAAAAAGGKAVSHNLAPDGAPITFKPAAKNLVTAVISEIKHAGSEQQRSQSGGQGGSSSSSSEDSSSGSHSYDTGSSGSEPAGEITEGTDGSSGSGGGGNDGDDAGGSDGGDRDDGGGGGEPPGGAGAPGMPNLGDIFNGMFFLHLLVMVIVLLLLYLGILKDPFLPAVGLGDDDADSGC